MLFKFNTDDMTAAKAALLLYAMYKSREATSSLTGKDTWKRTAAYIKGSYLKSDSLAEFIETFCRKAKIDSIKPKYLTTDEPVMINEGEYLKAEGVLDYKTALFEDDAVLERFNKETQYIIILVRDRLQREKLLNNGREDTEDESDED